MRRTLLASIALLAAGAASAQISDYRQYELAGKPALESTGAPGQATGNVVTLFSDRSSWQLATNVAAFESFDGGATGAGQLNSCDQPVNSASNDACFAPGDLIGGFQLVLGDGGGPRAPTGGSEFVVLGDGFLGQSTAVIGPNDFEQFMDIRFSAGDVNAVAFDAYSGATGGEGVAGAGVTVRVYDTGEVLVDAFIVPTQAGNVPVFVGFISPVPVGHVEVVGNNGSGELIDGLAFGPAGTAVETVAVPVGSALGHALLAALLLLAGGLALGRFHATR
ncbi:MAG: hypothetical protein KDI37_10350 [Xanthomonadales bacterium]|nr:hypothetical protein [Xanthomonadales bacterium]MCB1633559.1 hypothetical protein [Xanthomonadales bacterium]MCB1642123.1 hypothetical protein [Xanthomonadales bacterium]